MSDIRSFYPSINEVGASRIALFGTNKTDTIWTAFIIWYSLSQKINKAEATGKIQKYLQTKLAIDTVWLFSKKILNKSYN